MPLFHRTSSLTAPAGVLALLLGLNLAMPLAAADHPATATAGNAADQAEQKLIKDAILGLYQVTADPLELPPGAEAIFGAKFYSVTCDIPGTGMSSGHRLIAVMGTKVEMLEDLTTTHPMPKFFATIVPGYRIKNRTDARVFETALDVLYPIDDRGSRPGKKTTLYTPAAATFVRGEFFDKSKGFVLTLDASGKVTGLDYALGLKL